MGYYAEALSHMDLRSYEPAVDSDAPDKSLRIATQAALSRRKPIQDAHDCWNPTGHAPEECVTAGSGSLSSPIAGTESDPTTGLTGTCDAQGIPLNTGGAFSLEG
jgi:hypothetical protein